MTAPPFLARRGRIVLLTGLAVVLAALSAAGTAAAKPAATGSIPSSTTLVSSDTAVLPGFSSQFTVTASVRPGFLVGPAGSVTFTDATNGAVLGTASVSSTCFFHFKPCPASTLVNVSALESGLNNIVASFSGTPLLKPSTSAATQVFVETVSTNDGTTTVTCGLSCDTGTIDSPDFVTQAEISGTAAPSAQVTLSFSTDALPCSTLDTNDQLIGDQLIFSAIGITSNKTVLMDMYGDAADALNADYNGGEHVCYESPQPFATVPGTPPATLDPTTGLYSGLLPQCIIGKAGADGTAPNPPCVDFASFTPSDEVDVYTQQFETTAADPRATN